MKEKQSSNFYYLQLQEKELGANAVNLENMQAAIYIGHPKAGTINVALQAVLGRRVELYLPIGLEKRFQGISTR